MTQLYRQSPAAETAPMGAGLVVLEPGSRKFCALNPTSTVIWNRLKEPASLEELTKCIVDNFQGVSESDAARDVGTIIDEMTALAIIVPVR